MLITGVTSGLGRALAEHFMEAGHTVVGCARRAELGGPSDWASLDLSAYTAYAPAEYGVRLAKYCISLWSTAGAANVRVELVATFAKAPSVSVWLIRWQGGAATTGCIHRNRLQRHRPMNRRRKTSRFMMPPAKNR